MISRKIVYNILTFLLTITLIFGVSIFTYGTFYFAYMPSEVFVKKNSTSRLFLREIKLRFPLTGLYISGSRRGDQLPVQSVSLQSRTLQLP